jgi:hypothetical protein
MGFDQGNGQAQIEILKLRPVTLGRPSCGNRSIAPVLRMASGCPSANVPDEMPPFAKLFRDDPSHELRLVRKRYIDAEHVTADVRHQREDK